MTTYAPRSGSEMAADHDPRTALELTVVGTALVNPHQFPQLASIINEPGIIRHPPARAVWDLLAARIPKNLPVDYSALQQAIDPAKLQRIGGPVVFGTIADHVTGDAEWHAKRLVQLAVVADARIELARAANALDSLTDEDDLAELLQAIQQRAAKLTQRAEDNGITARQARRLVLTPASEIKIRPVRWMWDTTPEGAPPTSHGRIPLYSLAIAAGGPGLGKSQWACWLTAQVTRGTLPGDLHGRPRAVIYAATEDSWTYTIAPRLIAAGADMDLVFRVDVQDDGAPYARLSLPVDTKLLGQAAEMYGVALLVADPLLSMIDKTINDYRAAEVRTALEPLVEAADKHGFTILGLAHFTKNGGSDPVSRIAGSGAFGQLIRSLVAFAHQDEGDDDGQFVMSLEKNNLGRLGLPSFSYTIQPVTVDTEEGPSYVSRFVLGGESTTSVREALRSADGLPGADRTELSEAAEWLLDYLQDPQRGGEAPPKDIEQAARAAGVSPNALRTAKKKLKIRSVKPAGVFQAQWVWQLPTANTTPD
ncbi:AAA domain-containing protein [Streptomyces sp. TLI_235]|nr:AAA family ATPase [Streptomyces sp. TLI_235]PBC80153.1 AAA domain-containing protein [Streptomyces sp. TLI_235]